MGVWDMLSPQSLTCMLISFRPDGSGTVPEDDDV